MEQKRGKRILFVDDEPNILTGLQRMLRSMRGEWEMRFAQSGQEALQLLAEEPFDVVVSDMRMPGMDGAQLLGEVRNNFPQIVRIVLSGHSDQDLILKSVRPAHQYLSKPCDTDTLKLTIQRAEALRDHLTTDALRRVVSQTDSLPSVPALYAEIMDELRSPETSLQKIGEIISKDPAMTAKILQLVNSAFFGIPRQISSPAQAVNLLGLDTVKALVLTVGVFSQFDEVRQSRFDIDKLWNHSIRTSAFAKEIAKTGNGEKGLVDSAFMAGMLHDVGKLVFATNLSDSYREVIDLMQNQEISFHGAEHQVMGATHAEVGAYLLGLWGLPDAIIEAVAFHHAPRKFPSDAFSSLTALHIANALEHGKTASSAANNPVSGIDYEYLDRVRMTDRLAEWQEICEKAIQNGGSHD